MPLSRGYVNPLGVLGLRKLSFVPEHFTKVTVNPNINVKLLDHWINYNLIGRYAFRKKYIVNNSNLMQEVLEIGLEDPKEATLITLGCPYLYITKEF